MSVISQKLLQRVKFYLNKIKEHLKLQLDNSHSRGLWVEEVHCGYRVMAGCV